MSTGLTLLLASENSDSLTVAATRARSKKRLLMSLRCWCWELASAYAKNASNRINSSVAAMNAGRSRVAAASAARLRIVIRARGSGGTPSVASQPHQVTPSARMHPDLHVGCKPGATRGSAVSTQWERQQKAREEKLQNIKDQVEEGSLVIRKMTDAERKANPPKPPREKKPPRR